MNELEIDYNPLQLYDLNKFQGIIVRVEQN